MAIRLPSLVQVSATVWSGDDALDLPKLHRFYDAQRKQAGKRSRAEKKELSPDEIKALDEQHKKDLAKLEEEAQPDLDRLTVARETGDYKPILKDGESPTWFHLRVIPGTLMRSFQSALSSNELADFNVPALALRLALTKVENLEGVTCEQERDPKYGTIAKSSIIDALDAINAGIVNELGGFALSRSFPKSE